MLIESLINTLVDNLKIKEIDLIKSISNSNEMIQFHHSYGRWLRNTFHLWDENSNYHKVFVEFGINHPDDMSYIILIGMWYKINKGSFNLNDLKEEFNKSFKFKYEKINENEIKIGDFIISYSVKNS